MNSVRHIFQNIRFATGKIVAKKRRWIVAANGVQRAIFSNTDELLNSCEWQLGRIWKESGDF